VKSFIFWLKYTTELSPSRENIHVVVTLQEPVSIPFLPLNSV